MLCNIILGVILLKMQAPFLPKLLFITLGCKHPPLFVSGYVFEHSPTQAVTTGQMYIMAVTL